MPDINTINGLVLCDETNVNGVTITNITNIDGITKNCVTCTADGPIRLGNGATCALACAETHCGNYYTDGNVDSCPLVNGDHLYIDTDCTCVEPGYYSPKSCEEWEDCAYCYFVGAEGDCTITVSACPGESCNAIDLAYDSRACSTACRAEECTRYYVNQEVECPLSIGTAIYTDGECSECAAAGFYSPNMCEGEEICTSCYTFSDDESCTITRVDTCPK